MSSPLSRSPSGDPFDVSHPEAGAQGDIFPKYDATLREFVAATLPAGGAITPLSTVLFVDGGTTTPLADQDGSIAAPFAEIQDAITANPEATLYLTPGHVYGNASVPDGGAIQLIGMGNENATIVMGSLTVGDAANCSVSDVHTGAVTLGTGSFLEAFNSFSLLSVAGGDVVNLNGHPMTDPAICECGDISTGALTASGVAFSGTVTTVSDAQFRDSTIGGAALTVGGNFSADLSSLTAFRASAVTIAVTGSKSCLDAPSVTVTANVDSVAGAPKVVQQTVALPGAKPGDTFAVSPKVVSGSLAGISYGSPVCTVAGSIDLPITITAEASPVSVDLTVTRFTVADAL